MKYIIDIPNELLLKDDGYSFSDGKSYCITGKLSNLTPYTNIDIKEKAEEFSRGYDEGWDAGSKFHEAEKESIKDDVWEFAKICTKMNGADSVDVFGGFSPDSFTKFSYQEAKAKYEEWKKSKSEIRVGDEVFHKDYPTYKAVVTKLYQSGYLCAEVLFPDGMTDKEIIVSNLIKTGRHFPEVAELLEKMRGEEE